MSCPICDQKPANCDCTPKEREQHSEIEHLTLTDEEQEAVRWAAECADAYARVGHRQAKEVSAALRKLLERLT